MQKSSEFTSFTSHAGAIPKFQQGKTRFVLALGGSEISDVEGLSAAGNTAEARRITPALDGDALSLPLENKINLPRSPLGVTSPVVITRAFLSLFEHDLSLVDCGSFQAPTAAHISLSTIPAKNFSEQEALPKALVKNLFSAGLELGASNEAYTQTVIAECVPGGTTTAQALMRLLGIDCRGLASSSIPDCSHDLKTLFIDQAFENLCKRRGESPEALQEKCRQDPLLAVSLAGDPMQAFAAGFVLGAAQVEKADNHNPLILAGGSQMLAVYALANRLNRARPDSERGLNAVVATTHYVALDPHADCPALAALCEAPFIAANLRLKESRHAGLRAYEDGHVKEGVGAGAAMILASLHLASLHLETGPGGKPERTIIDTIDHYYDLMVS
jgi:uncharacterized protein (TIGR00303 family)